MTDETIFAVALEKAGAGERAAYLAEACATDPEQRKRVEGLLAALDMAGKFLERPAVAVENPDAAATRAEASPSAAAVTGTHLGDDAPQGEGESDVFGLLAPSKRPGALGRIGHYEVLEVLGRGGFGIVFRAFDETLQRVVAVKVLSPAMAATSPARKRFLREARSSAAVQHENVVRVHAVSRDDEPVPYLVMEFISGKTLQDRLDQSGPFEFAEVVQIGRQVSEGLAAAHEKGLIHRDIKPSNILVAGTPPQARITDFGLARAADDASLTRSGTVAGTPLYMAPEQARGEALDHRADLFSLGSVLYVMLTGRPPFRAETTLAVLKRVCDDTPRPIREVIAEVPEWLCRIVEKLQAKDPAERFQTAKEVADLLTDCERQLATHKELRDFSRIPGSAAPVPSRRRFPAWAAWAWAWAAVIGLALTSWAFPEMDQFRAFVQGALVLTPVAMLIAARRRDRADQVATTPPRRWPWGWALVAPILVLFTLVVAWAFPSVALYSRNRGELELLPQEGLVSVIVLQNDAGTFDANRLDPMVTDWLGMKQSHRLKLPPGKYQLNAGTFPAGTKIPHWEVTTAGLFGSETRLVPGHGELGWSVIVTVERGCRTTVRPVVKQFTSPLGKPELTLTGVDDWMNVTIRQRGVVAFDKVRAQTFVLDADAQTELLVTAAVNGNELVKQTFVLAPGERKTIDVAAELAAIEKRNRDTIDSNKLKDIGKAMQDYRDPVLGVHTVPTKAADMLAFIRGTWKRNSVTVEPKLPPGEARSLGQLTFDALANGKVMRGLSVDERGNSKSLVLHSYDSATDRINSWYFSDDGETSSSRAGVYDPANRSFLWMERLADGTQSVHHLDFTDANTVKARHYDTDAANKVVYESQVMFTRTNQPPATPITVTDPKRPVEMKVLDRLVGDWRDELTLTNAAVTDKPKVQRQRTTARLILGGRFVEATTTDESTETSSYAVFWFDAAAKHYRQWFFNDNGNVFEFTGTWDDATKTLTWNSTDKRLEGRNVFKSPDLREYRRTAKAPDGKVLSESTGVSRRVAPVTPVTDGPNPAIVQPLKDAVAAKQRTLDVAKARYESGIASKIELRSAEAELSEAQAALAEADGDLRAAVARLEEMVKQRQEERDLIAVRVEVGTDRPDVLSRADARVAVAKALLAKGREKAPATDKQTPEVAPVPRPKP